MNDATPDVLFYHLEHQPLDKVLPNLLEKTIERGWRAVVQAGSAERLDALCSSLWTYRDESFLAHGRAGDGHAAHQPIWLTTGDDNPNGAGVRFMVDGAETTSFKGYVRIVYLFDGSDDAALARARAQWKAVKTAGLTASYWQQSEGGRWEKKA